MTALKTAMTLILALLVGAGNAGACFCIGCTHEDDAVCSTCDNPTPAKKSCCSEPEQQKHKDCSHHTPTLKAHGPTPEPLVAVALPIDAPVAAEFHGDVVHLAPKSHERVKRKLFLLNASLLI